MHECRPTSDGKPGGSEWVKSFTEKSPTAHQTTTLITAYDGAQVEIDAIKRVVEREGNQPHKLCAIRCRPRT